jgi:hypothetical protein
MLGLGRRRINQIFGAKSKIYENKKDKSLKGLQDCEKIVKIPNQSRTQRKMRQKLTLVYPATPMQAKRF